MVLLKKYIHKNPKSFPLPFVVPRHSLSYSGINLDLLELLMTWSLGTNEYKSTPSFNRKKYSRPGSMLHIKTD